MLPLQPVIAVEPPCIDRRHIALAVAGDYLLAASPDLVG
jgi:hypothetical protein